MGICTSNSLNNVNNDLEMANSDIKEFSLKNKDMWGKVVYVYDGDTVHIVFKIDGDLVKFNCRLLGVDSPEISPKNILDINKRKKEIESAIKSRNYLISRISNIHIIKENMTKNEIKTLCSDSTKLIWVKPYDFDKYGRLLVELYDSPTSSISFNKEMIDNKYAVEYDGGTKQTFDQANFN